MILKSVFSPEKRLSGLFSVNFEEICSTLSWETRVFPILKAALHVFVYKQYQYMGSPSSS